MNPLIAVSRTGLPAGYCQPTWVEIHQVVPPDWYPRAEWSRLLL